MASFIGRNPGLRSRFNKKIHFPDYSVDEMTLILNRLATSHGYTLTVGAVEAARTLFQFSSMAKDDSFGNARLVRNTFERAIHNQSDRLTRSGAFDSHSLGMIVEEDIPAFGV